MTARKIQLITGESGSGKTEFCAGVVNALRQGDLSRMDIRGILSTNLMRGGKKVGIQAVNLVTYEHKNLAELNDGETAEISTKRWRFDPKIIAWCNTVLADAIPCDVLVLDEIGPLEFEKGDGFIAGMQAVDSGDYRLALVVVRPHLIEQAQERWPEVDILDVQKLKRTRPAIEQLANRLER